MFEWQNSTLMVLPKKVTHTGCFLHWASPKKIKYGEPRLDKSTLTKIVLDTTNLAKINFSVLRTFRGRPSEKTPCIFPCFIKWCLILIAFMKRPLCCWIFKSSKDNGRPWGSNTLLRSSLVWKLSKIAFNALQHKIAS